MKSLWHTIQTVFAIISGSLISILGGLDGTLITLTAFIVIDYTTGVTVAIMKKKLSSSIGAKGIVKKLLIFVSVSMSYLLDTYILNESVFIRPVIIFFYISNEGISIIENLSGIGVPIPKKLKNILEQLRDKDS